MRKPKIVHVKWKDSNIYGGWDTLENKRNGTPATCESVGWLIESNRSHIVLVMSCSEFMNACDSIVIPRACVEKISQLRKEE